ncbi:AraC-like DNA-binding protein [Arthrobacter sp. CAN_A6]|uniref:AraC family transcriptional regulator n=1 Tax=Arthrobacter sp. CAN_A6 TaxID=2787721 RepID=UPI0018C9B935
MDPLTQFLAGPRARSAFALRVVMDPPFSIDVRDGAALTLIIPVRGTSWLVHHQEPPQPLVAGQAVTVRGPGTYRVADTPERPPTVVIGAGQVCSTPSGNHLPTTMNQGVRTWGNAAEGSNILLIGTYQSDAAVGRLVTAALPAVAVFTATELDPVLLELLERELGRSAIGQQSALDRILDLLLLHLVRACANRTEVQVPSWLAGAGDPIICRALALLHDDPRHPWTVAELARHVHLSRASLAARFSACVGQPPMAYLTAWRMALAADQLLAGTEATSVIAADVGYSTAFTFSNAFSRAYGTSPTAYRRRGRPDA